MSLKKVLVVDDEPAIILLVKRILSGEFDVEGAEGGKNALKLVEKRLPDLVLLDIMMPRMDGWEFLERFRNVRGVEDVPVIMLSARSQASEVLSGMAVDGVSDYITKPFTKEDLRERIKGVLGDG
jgi:putative two-component system response regulator